MKFAKKRKVMMWAIMDVEDLADKMKWVAVMFTNPARFGVKK